MKTLYLVDVSAMFFRAYYAIRPLSTSKGFPTNALHGFLSMTVKLLRELPVDYMAFCFDVKGPSFRKELDPRYKAHRTEMPDDLALQVPYISRLTTALGIPRFEAAGFEADDVIGTLAAFGRREDLDVTIVSGDKDFAQLVKPYVTLLDTMKEERMDSQAVIEKWGITPSQFVDYLSIVGDSSDNIPGVKGIGQKGAQKLLAQYQSLDSIYEHLSEIRNASIAKKLEEGRDEAYLSRTLVTIREDVPFNLSLKDLSLKEIDKEQLHSLLQELEFRAFEKRLIGSDFLEEGVRKNQLANVQTQEIMKISESEVSASDLHEKLKKGQDLWGFLTERGLYLGIEGEVLVVRDSLTKIAAILDEKDLQWKGYDLKKLWKELDLTNPKAKWDQMLAAYVARTGPVESFEEIFRRYVGDSLPELPTPQQTYQNHLRLEESLRKEIGIIHGEKILFEIELPLIPVLYSMERHGILIDQGVLRIQGQDLSRELKSLEREIHDLCGESFNIASPKQLSQILFVKMKMPVQKKTKTGFSTDSEVLEKLAESYPVCSKIIEHREISKLKTTYVDVLPLLVDKKTGRIHTHFNQALTATGRLSSHNPNLQNIPIRSERGVQIRRAFIAQPGFQLLAADYSQVELRILAHITEDKGLCRAFESGEDIHAMTAAEIYGVELNEVNSELRRRAKAVNFGIAYGQGSFGLSQSLKISPAEASEIISRYFEKFPGVQDYMNATVETAKSKGYVETLFGRRRYIEELKSKNGAIRKFGERAAINAPIQGTTSDLVKKAMVEIHRDVGDHMLLQVHDELVFEIASNHVEETRRAVVEKMEGVVKLKVPLKVTAAVGTNWEEAHS